MYQKAVIHLVMVQLMLLFAVLLIFCLQKNSVKAFANEEDAVVTKEQSVIEINGKVASGQRIINCDVLEKQYVHSLDKESVEILCRIVEAEAGCEDAEGKLLVANVVLNRVEDEQFPDTVEGVVFQRENGVSQFSPVSDGRYYQVTVSEETLAAVDRALMGEDNSEGALFFAAREHADSERMKWFDEELVYLFEHGGHEFFALPD